MRRHDGLPSDGEDLDGGDSDSDSESDEESDEERADEEKPPRNKAGVGDPVTDLRFYL